MHYIGFGIFWAICGIMAALLATGQGRGDAKWVVLGLLLGPVGLGLAAFRVGAQECHFCHSRMPATATLCPTCHREAIQSPGLPRA